MEEKKETADKMWYIMLEKHKVFVCFDKQNIDGLFVCLKQTG